MLVPSPRLSVLRVPTEIVGAAVRNNAYITHIYLKGVVVVDIKILDIPGEGLFVLREPKPENTKDREKPEM